MRLLVIPDIHLKLDIIEKADVAMNKYNFDGAVFLGDFVDDWDKQNNIALYEATLQRLLDFLHHYDNSIVCLGNHDVSYVWELLESGYSFIAEISVKTLISKLMREYEDRVAFIHKIDNVIFSHAGITQNFLLHYIPEALGDFDYIIETINQMKSSILWASSSPIWARPDDLGKVRYYSKEYLQVVGHTPVVEPTFYPLQNLLVCDNFSTYKDGSPIGNEKFIWVDTETKEWNYVDE